MATAGCACWKRLMMVPEQAMAVLKQIPDNDDIDGEYPKDERGIFLVIDPDDEFVELDGDEEHGFADGQPAGPAHAKGQSDAFDEGEQAVGESAHPVSYTHLRAHETVLD